MKRSFFIFAFYWCLAIFISPAYSQSTDSLYSFYPLHVGDVWEYDWGNYISNPPSHLYYQRIQVIADTVMQNGLHYFAVRDTFLNVWQSYLSFQRIDTSDGYVHEWLTPSYEPPFQNINLRSPSRTVDTIFGVPTQARSSGLFDYGRTVAYGFGIVAETDYGTGWPYRSKIIYARIDSVEYGTALSVDPLPTIPTRSALCQNFPNPFNPTTTIRIDLPHSTYGTLKIFDLLGRELRTLTSGYFTPGTHEFRFDASGLPSGIYLYRLRTTQFTQTRAMVYAK